MMTKFFFILLSFFACGLFFLLWVFWIPGKIHLSPKQSLLIQRNEEFLEQMQFNLKKHIYELSEVIGERNLENYEKYQETLTYLILTIQEMGYFPQKQSFQVNQLMCQNIFFRKEGLISDAVIVVGAHYDSVMDCPGANDNASGVAMLLETARLLQPLEISKTIEFVLFANEEPPYFKTNHMGSYQYAKQLADQNKKIDLMICLETVGYFTNQKNSQQYPLPLTSIYGNQGNFLACISNLKYASRLKQFVRYFRSVQSINVYGLSLPKRVQGVEWSDHMNFWNFNFPAIMLTDTAFYRYPYYHHNEDTYDKISYLELAKISLGLKNVLLHY